LKNTVKKDGAKKDAKVDKTECQGGGKGYRARSRDEWKYTI